MTDTPTTDAPPEDAAPATVEAPAVDTNPAPDRKPGDWPEAPFEPAAPQFPGQLGKRIKVWLHVSLFGLDAQQEVEVFDVAEVHECERVGLLEIRS